MIDQFKHRIVVSPPGPRAKELIRRDRDALFPSLTRTVPLVGVETEGVWVKDIDGNVYLDFGSGIACVNVGHRHPAVVRAMKEQIDKCDHVNKRMRQGVDEQKFLLVSCQFLNLLPHPPLTPPEDLGNPDLPLHGCPQNTLHETG